MDDLGWKVYRLRHARIIRRPVGSPRNPNGSYYWNLLLEHVVFRAEEDVVAPDGDYMKMCIKHKVFTSTAELDQHLKAYAHYNLWDTVKLNELRHHVRSAFDTQQPLGAMQHAPEHTADDLLAGADAMQAVVDAETGVYEGATLIDPIQRLHELITQGQDQPAPGPSPDQAKEAEAKAACSPLLRYPLSVTYDALSNQQQAAICTILQAVEDAQRVNTQGAGTHSSRPYLITLQGGPGGCSAWLGWGWTGTLCMPLIHQARADACFLPAGCVGTRHAFEFTGHIKSAC
jgi:hypothetical protein